MKGPIVLTPNLGRAISLELPGLAHSHIACAARLLYGDSHEQISPRLAQWDVSLLPAKH